jgi:hypothetical protein
MSMMGAGFIAVGAVLMILGVLMLTGWVAGKSRWFDPAVYDRRGGSKTDRMFLYLYFLAIVISPMALGALLIILGLQELR